MKDKAQIIFEILENREYPVDSPIMKALNASLSKLSLKTLQRLYTVVDTIRVENREDGAYSG